MCDSHWKDKLWYAYGTSMTSTSWGKFVPVVEELSGLKAVNRGVPAGSLTPDGILPSGIMKAVMEDDGKEKANLITLEVLPNEGKKIGDIYDTDEESFCGCLNRALRFLQETTDAQIVVILMIMGNEHAPGWKSDVRGIPEFEFCEIAERVAKLNSVPVINAYCESGFGYARVKDRKYQYDQIHLNELGGRNMGRFIWSKLKDIPLWEGPGKLAD